MHAHKFKGWSSVYLFIYLFKYRARCDDSMAPGLIKDASDMIILHDLWSQAKQTANRALEELGDKVP